MVRILGPGAAGAVYGPPLADNGDRGSLDGPGGPGAPVTQLDPRRAAAEAATVSRANAELMLALTELLDKHVAEGAHGDPRFAERFEAEAASVADETFHGVRDTSDLMPVSLQALSESLSETAGHFGRRAETVAREGRVHRTHGDVATAQEAALAAVRRNPALRLLGQTIAGHALAVHAADLTPAEKEDARSRQATAMVRADIEGRLRADPEMLSLKLNEPDAYPELDRVERDYFRQVAERRAKSRRSDAELAEMRAEQDRAILAEQTRFATLHNLDAKIADGALRHEDIADAVDRGALTPADGENMVKRIAGKVDENHEKQSDIWAVQKALERGEPLDPADPERQRKADAYFETVIAPRYADRPPEERAKAEDDYARKIGVLPTAVVRGLRSGLHADDPTTILDSARRILKLEETHRGIVAHISPAEFLFIKRVAPYADLPLPTKKLIELTEHGPGYRKDDVDGRRFASEVQVADGDDGAGQGFEAAARRLVESGDVVVAVNENDGGDSSDTLDEVIRQFREVEATGRDLPVDPETGYIRIGSALVRPEVAELLHRALTFKTDEEMFALGGELRELRDPDDPRSPLLDDAARNVLQQILNARRGDGELSKMEDDEVRALVQQSEVLLEERQRKFATSVLPHTAALAVGRGRNRPSRIVSIAIPRPITRPVDRGALVPGRGFRHGRKFITKTEFDRLPERGFIDPQTVRTSQAGFRNNFRVGFSVKGPHIRNIDDLEIALKSRQIEPADLSIHPVRIVEHNGDVCTLDHRRFVAARRAGVSVPYVKEKFQNLSPDGKERIREARLTDNGAFIVDRNASEIKDGKVLKGVKE